MKEKTLKDADPNKFPHKVIIPNLCCMINNMYAF